MPYPRKKRKNVNTDSDNYPYGNDFNEFVSRHIVQVKRNLIHSFLLEKLNHKIHWCPNKLSNNVKPNPKGHGSNNTHYVIPKFDAVFGGRSAFPKSPTWEDVEAEAARIWNLDKTSQAKTRNIDYWRTWQQGPATYKQACEVKKTTGCFERQPVFIRSSQQQLEALTTLRALTPGQIGPSIYIVGSCDFDQIIRGWFITWWFIPAAAMEDFIIFNTSGFPHTTWKTDVNNGWIKPP